jgi:hypothetical protein
MWLRDGKLIGVNRDVLPELVSKYVFTKSVVAHGGKFEVVYVPVVLDERLIPGNHHRGRRDHAGWR